MSSVMPKQHVFPSFLAYKGTKPLTNVEFLFPTQGKPVGPNSRHVRTPSKRFRSSRLRARLFQVDTGCLNSYAVQLQGTKMWLLWPPPTRDQYGDLHNSSADLKPVATILHPGDLLVFFPGWLHETHVIDWPSLSMSIYWGHPHPDFQPTRFYSSYGRDILRTYPSEYCPCAGEWLISSDNGEDFCWDVKLQAIYSKLLVGFIMCSITSFVLVSGIAVSSFLKRFEQHEAQKRVD